MLYRLRPFHLPQSPFVDDGRFPRLFGIQCCIESLFSDFRNLVVRRVEMSTPPPLQAALLAWAYAPEAVPFERGRQGTTGHTDTLSSEGLNLDFVPASQRRRCSSFSKVTLAVAHAAVRGIAEGAPFPTVFASAHGESDITANLLRELAEALPLSPMGFSLSVHNAASGLYSIATGNRGPATALAAGDRTFLMGLCDALLTLHQENVERVLYVCSDERVAEVFLPAESVQPSPYALALMLGKADQASGARLSVTMQFDENESDSAGGWQHATKFAKWLAGPEPSLSLCASGTRGECYLEGSCEGLYRSAVRG